jgi:RHS repeat-associated protein
VSPPQRQFERSVSIEAEYTYDAFGNLIEDNDHNNPYGFTGEQQFREADGLIFLRARYYDPNVGRFISKDPILKPMMGRGHRRWMLPHIVRFPQMLHHYVYVHNNPVNLTDPTGLLPEHLLPLSFFDGGAIDCILRAYEETGRLLEEGIGDAAAHCYLSCRANRCLRLLGPVTVMMGGFLWEVAEIPDPVGYFSWPDMEANLQGVLASYNLGKSCRELCDPLYQCGQ